MRKIIMFFSCLLIVSPGVLRAQSTHLPNGAWLGKITRDDGQQIFFNFETKDSAGKKIIYIINGGERLLVDEISSKGDSVFIKMPFFDSRFETIQLPDGNLQGKWIKNIGTGNQVFAFTGLFKQDTRFAVFAKPSTDISGTWDTRFYSRTPDQSSLAIGEFKQQGALVTGTFLTTTGDYRYLQGVLSGDTLRLSTFDGGHAYAFSALVTKDSMTLGTFYAGATGFEQWTARRNDTAQLPDEYSLTTMKPGQSKLDFSFKSIDGTIVSIHDPAFKNKVVVIQIMGSWCPNCMDETRYLSAYYKSHRSKGVEMIALAYERTTDFERSKRSLEAFRKRFAVDYPVLVTGVTVSDTALTEKTLPQLRHITGFPTTIFIDRKGVVRKISTGFNGPGTGAHYEAYKTGFDALVTSLLQE